MRRAEALAILQAHREELRRRHVKSLALFGSVARDEAGPDSDVDLLVEFEETPSLLTLIALEQELSDLLGVAVDLVPRGALRPAFRAGALADQVPV
jgi:predicted nucleotidyltransferase